MRARTKAPFLVALSACSLAGMTPCVAQNHVAAWHLLQDSLLIGPHELFVSDSKLRSLDRNLGIATILSGTDKKVFVLDLKKKRYFESNLEQFEAPDNVRTYTPYKYDLFNRHWQKFEDTKLNNHQVRGYKLMPSRSTLEGNESFHAGKTTGVHKASYWECTDIPVKKELLLGIEKLYVVPRLNGLPIKLVFIPRKGGPRLVLNTSLLEKVSVARSLFTIPADFKRATSLSQLGDNTKRDAVLESVTDMLLRE